MKTFHVHFSFYDEESGEFDEAVYTVSAESLSTAKRGARLLRDKDDNGRLQPGADKRKYGAAHVEDEESECPCADDEWEDEL